MIPPNVTGYILNYDEKKRKEMGLNARKRAIAFFDEKIIINSVKKTNRVVTCEEGFPFVEY